MSFTSHLIVKKLDVKVNNPEMSKHPSRLAGCTCCTYIHRDWYIWNESGFLIGIFLRYRLCNVYRYVDTFMSVWIKHCVLLIDVFQAQPTFFQSPEKKDLLKFFWRRCWNGHSRAYDYIYVIMGIIEPNSWQPTKDLIWSEVLYTGISAKLNCSSPFKDCCSWCWSKKVVDIFVTSARK